MASRTGIPSLMSVASVMCALLTKFTPIITKLYPENAALLAALAAAQAACAVLTQELSKVRAYGD